MIVFKSGEISQGPGDVDKTAVIYLVLFRGDTSLYRLNYDDLSVAAQFDLGYTPHGCGGDKDVVYVGDENDRYHVEKRNPDDLSLIESGELADIQTEMGGDSNSFYYVDSNANPDKEVHEAFPSTFNEAQTAKVAESPSGVGGTDRRVWFSSAETNKVYELDRNNFNNVLNSADMPSDLLNENRNVVGCGGGDNHVYTVMNSGDGANGYLLEHDTETLQEVRRRELDFGSGEPSGVGGV